MAMMSCDHLNLSSSYEKATIVFWSKNLISIKMFIATNFCRLPASYGAPTSSLRPLYPLSTILLQVSLRQLFFRRSSGVHRKATLGRAEGGIRSAWLISFPRVKCNREFCFFLFQMEFSRSNLLDSMKLKRIATLRLREGPGRYS